MTDIDSRSGALVEYIVVFFCKLKQVTLNRVLAELIKMNYMMGYEFKLISTRFRNMQVFYKCSLNS